MIATPTTQVAKQLDSSQEANNVAANKVLAATLEYKTVQEKLLEEAERLRKEAEAKAKAEAEAKAKAEAEARAKAEAEERARQEAASLSRGGGKYSLTPETFKLTAYTLSEPDCGKTPGSYGYGISASGYDLNGEDLRHRKIAVDRRVIPLGSTVYIEFPEEIRYINFQGQTLDLNGEYTAVDVGGAIKNNKIDLFVGGDGAYYTNVANEIGVRYVKVYMRRN
jgi:3D (Asp-Asp-Asp) domain-containing protein